MGRLTERKEDRYFENEEFWVDAQQPSIDKIDDVYFKLAEFEDLMEEHDLNNIEQLDDLIIEYHYNRDEISFLKEEKEILEDRWQKLKELLKKHIEHNQKEYDGSFYLEFQHYSACENWVLDRMQELENFGDEGEEV